MSRSDKAWAFYERAIAQGRRAAAHYRTLLGDRQLPLTRDGRLIISLRTNSDVTTEVNHDFEFYSVHTRFERYALTLQRAAMFLRNRGRVAEARPLLDEAEGPDLLGKLLAHCPEVNAYRRADGVIQSERARIDLEEGRYADALARYDRLLALYRQLTDPAQPPPHPMAVGGYTKPDTDARNFGWAARGRAVALLGLKRSAEGEAALTEVLGLLDKLPKTDDRYATGAVLHSRGRVRAADPARRAEALADFDRAIDVLDACVRHNSNSVDPRREVMAARTSRGRLLAAGGPAERQRAEADFRAAVEIGEKLVTEVEAKPRGLELTVLKLATEVEAKPGPLELTVLADAEAGLGGIAADPAMGMKWNRSAVARYGRALEIWPNYVWAQRGKAEADAALARSAPPRSLPEK